MTTHSLPRPPRSPQSLGRLPQLSLLAAALALLGACSSVPSANPTLERALSEHAAARANPQTTALAAPEMVLADKALGAAQAAWAAQAEPAEVDHLAYLARQRVAIASTLGTQRSAEAQVAQADGQRDKLQLAARTEEADSAQRQAQSAQQQTAVAQGQADAAQRQAAQSQGRADAAQRQSAASQQQASSAQAANRSLEAQLQDMKARQTPRGMVVTIGDLLFDTNRSELKPGGLRSVEKLAAFLVQYPQRNAMIEGFTDSTGGDDLNQALSERRALAVRQAMVQLGVSADRLTSQGHGEGYPVASNDNMAGRQMNRRVEVVLSGDGGAVAPR